MAYIDLAILFGLFDVILKIKCRVFIYAQKLYSWNIRYSAHPFNFRNKFEVIFTLVVVVDRTI